MLMGWDLKKNTIKKDPKQKKIRIKSDIKIIWNQILRGKIENKIQLEK
jgi:hypothetical protein